MSVLLFVEQAEGRATESTLQAAVLARSLAGGAPLQAVAIGTAPSALADQGVVTVHVAEHELFSSYTPGAIARTIIEAIERTGATTVVGPGSIVGNEVLARVAARLDLPLAVNCVEAVVGESLRVTRVRWGGSLLEEAELRGPVRLLTVQPHTVSAATVAGGEPTVEQFTPDVSERDALVRVIGRVEAATGGVSLADAKLVVSCGRGAGGPEGFGGVEELAGLLGGAVGCSRAVTMAGWRPHTDQVGQTGTKIAPDLYIACGISGATQHMAGCKGAKRILAINKDREAPIISAAAYAVIGDLHEVVPAISAEIRRVRGQ